MPLNAPIQSPLLDTQNRPNQVWVRFFNQINGFGNTIIVRSPNDLRNIDSAKNYMIDGSIDMGNQSIIVPEGGLSLSGLNGGRDTSILTSSADNYTMFISPAGGYSGDVVIESCTLTASGTNSKIFDLDNDGNFNALDITGVNFTNCTSMGALTDYRQLLLDGVGFIFINDGLIFNGTWTGIACTTSIAVGFPASTLFKVGTGFSTTNVRTDINFLSTNSAAVLFDFAPSNVLNDNGMNLSNVRTSATNPLPNFPASDVKAAFSRCSGFENTYRGGVWTVATPAVTTVAAANTGYKVAGTTTYSKLDHFSGSNSNEFVYEADQRIEVDLVGILSLSGGNNDQINLYFRIWDASAGAYDDDFNLRPKFTITLNGGLLGSRAENATFKGVAALDVGDRIEVWGENATDTSSFTAEAGGFVSVSERPS